MLEVLVYVWNSLTESSLSIAIIHISETVNAVEQTNAQVWLLHIYDM